ncbi:zinc finger protein 761-like [Oppia nitens]|uniref:zinc finger protein 761-like n=1 Tax=Oppia nitens TaxID=1686743 RepID=UPI0023DA9E2E|nr:zinc finger protein 761-like [Oppia nitens]
MLRNGFDSVHTLRAINIDEDWHLLPTQISIGQKLLLRQALTKLQDITDDDLEDSKQIITPKPLVPNSQVFINLDNNMDTVSDNNDMLYSDNEVDSDNQLYQINDDLTFPSIINEFELKRLALQIQPVVVINRLKMPNNKSKTISNSRLNGSEVETKNNDCFKCVECDRYLSSELKLEIHVNSCHLKCRPFRCNKCRKGFLTNLSLLNHLAEKHLIKPFACNECNFKGRSKGLLIQHKVKHSTRRPFVCNYDNCNKSYKYKQNLSVHHKQIHKIVDKTLNI